jgi:hypothetical protein
MANPTSKRFIKVDDTPTKVSQIRAKIMDEIRQKQPQVAKNTLNISNRDKFNHGFDLSGSSFLAPDACPPSPVGAGSQATACLAISRFKTK